ncbi:MAG TPA: GTP 3',8-cyclase MoaA [Desulfosalsimonadaceae bacterium]|nr:GTP 3',8-cyclase MoaA [Desulfosalsimonadaceae bacterium]
MQIAGTRLIDQYRRNLNYLRISITDRCNLRCLYCNPAGTACKLAHEEILRYEEILRITRIAVRLGVNKIRITGGEPLVRKDCCAFLESLAGLEGLSDISLTTNGVLLSRYIDRIAATGIRRINISLDTLDREKYEAITGVDAFEQVWQGIESAYNKGLAPIKINVVVLNGINDQELTDLAALSFSYPFHIRFIEYMPIGRTRLCDTSPLLYPEIRNRLEQLGTLHPVERQENDGPAVRWKFAGAAGEIGFISPVSRHFCRQCNRLRLTADGRIRPCLLADISEDIKTPLRAGMLDTDLAEVFFTAVKRKPFAHAAELSPRDAGDSMVSIGG